MADAHELCKECGRMAISYNKLWILFIDKNMKI